MSISEVIEANLHKLDNRFISVNNAHRLGDKIAAFNKNISRCSCEVDGKIMDGKDIEPMANPFARKNLIKFQCEGSISESLKNSPLTWRTLDNSCVLELTL